MSEGKMSEDLEKMKLHSSDFADENIRKIAEIFPNCVTETQDSNGSLKFAIDYDELRQELSDHIVDGPQERYHLNWPGKREALLAANAPIAETLRPVRDESVEFDTTQNLFIEGDNLESLKLLRASYLGKVKMIYIDPPYNRGSDLIYKDRFAERAEDFLLKSGQTNSLGERLVSNTDANGRFHSDWLSMMYSRIKIARDFLSDDGAIFISIGDDEIGNLHLLCNQIFGEKNFVSQVTRIAKRTSDKGTHFRPTKDHILVYAKNFEFLPEFGIKKDRDEKDYKFKDTDGRKYKKSGASLYQPSLDSRPNQRYYIKAPDGSLIIPPGSVFPDEKKDGAKVKPLSNADKVWRWSANTYLQQKHLLIFTEGSSKNPLLDENGNQSKWNIYPKVYFDEDIDSTLHPEDVIYDYPNSQGTKELNALSIPFSFSKPSNLVVYLLNFMTGSDALVLDFFAGSGTTAHAVMQVNAEDGGNRQCISVQIPEKIDPNDKGQKSAYDFCVENNLEPNIAEISKERIRRAGAKILEGKRHPDWKKDIGFRVLKVDESNMRDVYYRPDEFDQKHLLSHVDNIKPDRTGEDMLFQVLVDWGVDLTLPIRHQKVEDKSVYFVDDDALIACFETDINEELVKKLATHKPLRVVFRDKGFASDDLKVNITQIFLQASPKTDVKVI